MSYRKDQGRYARMLAFWALLLLVAYGCFHGGGLANLLEGWMQGNNPTFIESFPLIKTLKASTCVTLGLLAVAGWVIHAVLNRPRIADALIDTELEMQKVTWPTWGEAWQGTLAVTAMVVVLFFFLTVVDLVLSKAMLVLISGGGA